MKTTILNIKIIEGWIKKCEKELQSTLEDWILVGLKLGHYILINS